MSNMIQAAREQVAALTQAAYERAAAEGLLPAGAEVKATIEIPKDVTHGDYASSFAMAGAKALRKAPRQIAEVIVSHLDLAGTFFDKVEIAGPGFLNFTLGSKWYGGVLADIQAEGETYGAVDEGRGERVMVEFVSANPTGPMHIGNARGGVLGDALAAVLERAGYDVWREFYVNDAGNQIHKFAMSIDARYLQLVLGEENVPLPEDGYHGDDIKELARGFYDQHGAGWKDKSEEERQAAMAEYGLSVNIPKMKEDLRRYKIEYDEWFLESSLHNSGYVAETVELLAGKGWTYEKDGALWLNTTALLKQKFLAEGKSQEQVDKLDLKDDVLFYTYFAADIAYHRNKLEQRGFSKAINIWGADHHGHVARLQAALDGLGLDGSHRLIIVLMQLVNLLQDGQHVQALRQGHRPAGSAGRGERGRRPLLLQLPLLHLRPGLRSGPGGAGGQREPGLLCPVRPRPHLLPHCPAGRGGTPRARRGGGGSRPLRHGGGEGPYQNPVPTARGHPPGRPGLRSLRRQPLSGDPGRRVSPLLQRLPYQG